MKPIFAASLMCMDFLNVGKELAVLDAGCTMLHADIMDGHFAKNITLSPDFTRIVKSASSLPVDAHLMVTNPGDYIDALTKARIDYISLHLETVNVDAFRQMRRIKDAGCKFGIALNPSTPLSMAQHLLGEVDMLTIMTVDVGYAGQPFIPQMLDKIEQAKQLRDEKGYTYIIQVDGGCGPKTYAKLWQAGASAFVMGSSGLFGRAETLAASCDLMKREFARETGIEVE